MCKKHYRAWLAYNRPVDNEIVRAHIERCRAAGMGVIRIGQLSGVQARTVRRITSGYGIRTTAGIARAILAVNPDVDRPAHMNPIGAIRRIRALAALGYTRSQIAGAVANYQINLHKYLTGSAAWVRPETFDRIDAAYQTLGAQPLPQGPHADTARRIAAARGWLPPLAWQDGEIDDPDAQGDPSVVLKPSRSVPSDFLDIVADHREHVGRTDAEIAKRLGITTETLKLRIRRIERSAS
ncbi:hypothetical protein AWB94_13940 [Mycolicibacterium canariasense]|nr:hypothetical protein AWB94_13940 [Mycolicibacterium canariasense]